LAVLLLEVTEFGRRRLLGHPQLQSQRDQPLLGSVVQVTFQTAARVIGGGDDSRT
jgi:hypothetical protein